MANETAHKEKLFDLISQHTDCMLVTHCPDSSAKLHARPMAPRVQKSINKILFVTDKNSAKCQQVTKHDDEVLLTFSKPNSWISVCGKTSISQDKELLDMAWGPAMDVWTKGKDDPNVCLMVFEPTGAQYWETTASKPVQLLEMAKSYTGMKTQPDISEAVKVPLK